MYLQEFSKNDVFKNILKTYPKFHFRIHENKISVNNLPVELYSIYLLEISDRPLIKIGEYNYSLEGNPVIIL